MRLAKKNAGLLRTTLLLVCSLWSFRISLASAPVAPLTFSFESWTYENVIFPYRKAVIATGSGQATPILVVYLHGGPKRGNDNVRQMQEQAIFTLPCDFYGGLQAVHLQRRTDGGIDFWGNCWEWTSSADANGLYIIKGGSWDSDRDDCRSEKSDVVRDGSQGYANVGFRVVRTVPNI